MGIFRSKAEKIARQWASPDCPNCHGRGRVQGAGNWMESCACVFENQKGASQAATSAGVARPQQSAFPTEEHRQAFLNQLSEVPRDELSDEEFHNPPDEDTEVRKFLILVSMRADDDLWEQVKARQITRCCLVESCFCTLNYYHNDLLPRAPKDDNAMAWIRYWTQWLYEREDSSVTALPRS